MKNFCTVHSIEADIIFHEMNMIDFQINNYTSNIITTELTFYELIKQFKYIHLGMIKLNSRCI